MSVVRCLLAMIAFTLAASGPLQADVPLMKRVVYPVQMGWIPDAHQAGFHVALADGLYEAEGLRVELRPGGATTNVTAAVARGEAVIGQLSGLEPLIAARANGLAVQGIAAMHGHTPHALISLRGAIRTPADLRGKRIAVAFGDAAETYLRELLAREGIRDDAVSLVPFGFDLQPLIEGRVDAVTGFMTDQAVTLRVRGYEPTVLSYRDAGIRRYGYTLVANPGVSDDEVRRFLRASREGWRRAFANPQHAIDVLRHAAPALDAKTELAKLEAIRSLMLNPDGTLAEWAIDPAVLADAQKAMIAYGQLRAGIDLDAAVRNVDASDQATKVKRAKGEFDVKLTPQGEPAGPAMPGRMLIDKQFHGDLEATSSGEMLTMFTAVEGSAGYVAIERVTGTLNGIRGSFALQHSGTMDRGAPSLSITVIPDSGTEGLTGLKGEMTIDITDGKHRYEFAWSLPVPDPTKR